MRRGNNYSGPRWAHTTRGRRYLADRAAWWRTKGGEAYRMGHPIDHADWAPPADRAAFRAGWAAEPAAFVASAAHDDATGFDGTRYPGWDEAAVDEYEAEQDNERHYRRENSTQEGE